MSNPEGVEGIGAYSNTYPGGYGELMVLSAMLATPVPNGLDPRLASLTEPMAVGQHAVNRSGIKTGEAALVLGAGPVGLACISALARMGIEPIVAADFSAKRRELALVMGAHEAVDPREEPAIEAWRRVDGAKPVVIFEAVGVPGMIDQAMRDAPRQSRVLVVGACMEPDTVRPIIGVGKELTISFALGYDPFEFGSTLRTIAEGEVDVTPMITGHVGIDGVPQAFDDLAKPDEHCKILVEPALG
jgi:threonine dehydrogenase-like Zn-dependent dehydrogenase